MPLSDGATVLRRAGNRCMMAFPMLQYGLTFVVPRYSQAYEHLTPRPQRPGCTCVGCPSIVSTGQPEFSAGPSQRSPPPSPGDRHRGTRRAARTQGIAWSAPSASVIVSLLMTVRPPSLPASPTFHICARLYTSTATMTDVPGRIAFNSRLGCARPTRRSSRGRNLSRRRRRRRRRSKRKPSFA